MKQLVRYLPDGTWIPEDEWSDPYDTQANVDWGFLIIDADATVDEIELEVQRKIEFS